jgi:hypothetical protein
LDRNCQITLKIVGMPILLHMQDDSFRQLLALRYAGFVGSAARPKFEFDIELTAPSADDPDENVKVQMRDGMWRLRRGDFRAQWDPSGGRGRIRQSANPYSIDSVLRIVHTLILAREGGILLHSAGAIRNGKAFLFSGVSGAGKTTISRLAPPDVTLLTDEVSYVRRDDDGYRACGTPFAGELARVGENCSAPIDCLFFSQAGSGEQDRASGQSGSHSQPDAEHPLFCRRLGAGADRVSLRLRICRARSGADLDLRTRFPCVGNDPVSEQ